MARVRKGVRYGLICLSACAIWVGVRSVVPYADAMPTSDRRVILDVPHLEQETLLCVPTAAAMILQYYGDAQSPRKLKTLASGREYDPSLPFDDFTITYYRDLVRAVQKLGYTWSEQSIPDTNTGFDAGIREIEDEIERGRPVMVDVSFESGGHTFVIEGFDSASRKLFIVDPGRKGSGLNVESYDEFKAIWNEHSRNGNFRALIKTQPKQ